MRLTLSKNYLKDIMTVDVNDFKQAMQYWSSGVTVVTTKTDRFGVQGMTATAFSSVSIDPPQVLICINDSAVPMQGIREGRCFAVNILNADQEHISNQFAGGCSQKQRFEQVIWSEGLTGSPLLHASCCSIDCKVIQQVRAGTHWVVIGEVENVICRQGEPLLYYRAGYRNLAI